MTIRTRPPRKTIVALQHFVTIKKLGFKDEVRCWCGAQTVMDRDFQAWLREHSECAPQQEEDGEPCSK